MIPLPQRNTKRIVYSDHYLQRLMETCLPVYLYLEPFTPRLPPHAVYLSARLTTTDQQ